jgi:hypothetical protein
MEHVSLFTWIILLLWCLPGILLFSATLYLFTAASKAIMGALAAVLRFLFKL